MFSYKSRMDPTTFRRVFVCLFAFSVACPSWSGKTCNSHGTCVDGHGGNGTCICEASVPANTAALLHWQPYGSIGADQQTGAPAGLPPTNMPLPYEHLALSCNTGTKVCPQNVDNNGRNSPFRRDSLDLPVRTVQSQTFTETSVTKVCFRPHQLLPQ